MRNKKEIIKEIAAVLNKYSAENESDTPDFILAHYLANCLEAWDGTCEARTQWYGGKAMFRADEDSDPDFVQVADPDSLLKSHSDCKAQSRRITVDNIEYVLFPIRK